MIIFLYRYSSQGFTAQVILYQRSNSLIFLVGGGGGGGWWWYGNIPSYHDGIFPVFRVCLKNLVEPFG